MPLARNDSSNAGNRGKIGIITSGGDCPGMNNCIWAAWRLLREHGYGLVLFRSGWEGLSKDDHVNEAYSEDFIHLCRGTSGTVIGAGRCPDFKDKPETMAGAAEVVKKHGLDGLIVLGGDGSLAGAHKFYQTHGVRSCVIPATIDNDIPGTTWSLGADTALDIGTQSTRMIRQTAEAHSRVFVVEVMGNKSGFLAVMNALSCLTAYVLVPENILGVDEREGADTAHLRALHRAIKDQFNPERGHALIIPMAEGFRMDMRFQGIELEFLRKRIAGWLFEDFGIRKSEDLVRTQALGYLQRGAMPTGFDLSLASRFTANAVHLLLSTNKCWMVRMENNEVSEIEMSTARELIEKERQEKLGLKRITNLPKRAEELAIRMWGKYSQAAAEAATRSEN